MQRGKQKSIGQDFFLLEESFRTLLMVAGIVFLISLAPWLLNVAGFQFNSPADAVLFTTLSPVLPALLHDHMHRQLAGSFLHTILEWSAFCTAFFTVVLSFIQLGTQKNRVALLVCISLFWAGCMDAFHTLAADRLLTATVDNTNLIPFTWALCRTFNAAIPLLGIGIISLKNNYNQLKNEDFSSLFFISIVSLVFGLAAYLIISYCATSDSLPQTMFPDFVITRPWDVAPLFLYLFAGLWVYPRFFKGQRNIFAFALWLSCVPNVATQLHMAFGSTALFDNHFNIAHFLKIIAYLIPFAGLAIDYLITYRMQEANVQLLAAEVAGHKKTVESLRESNERFQGISTSAQDAIIIMDEEENIFFWNRSAEKMFGYTAKEAQGKNLHTLIVPSHYKEEYTAGLAQFHHTGKGAIVGSIREGLALHKSGSFLPIELSVSAVKFKGNWQAVGLIRDTTERKQAEEQLKKRAADLTASNKELEQFAYIASHDLQEPLRMVSSYTQLLAKRYKGKLDSDANDFIGYAVDGVLRMQRLINDLLTYSRIGTKPREFHEVACEKVLQDVLRNLEVSIQEKAGVIHYGSLPVVMADASQLVQLFQNLIGNALKFCVDKPPEITITAEERADDWLFFVQDNGIGIDPKFAERIFVVFQRLHTAQEYAGTGIGLSVCQKIVQRHGGTLRVKSTLGSGATFLFPLPKHECSDGQI